MFRFFWVLGFSVLSSAFACASPCSLLLLSSLLSHFALSQAYIVFYISQSERDIDFAFNLDDYLYQCPGWFFRVFRVVV